MTTIIIGWSRAWWGWFSVEED